MARAMVRGLAWTATLSALGALLLALGIPRAAGATPYTVLTGSMRPDLPPGTLVVVRPVDAADVAVGDVVTYQVHSGESTVVTHRVVGVSVRGDGERRFQTRGDANGAADPDLVRPVQLRGRLWYSVPYLGRVSLLFSRAARERAVTVVAVGLLGYAVVMFAQAGVGRRRRTEVAS